MNIFLKIITSLGFLTVITQFLGIPHSWKEVITVIIGVAVMLVAFFIDRITLFLQKREDARYRDERSERGDRVEHSEPVHRESGARHAVAPFSTSLSTVSDAFTEVAQRSPLPQHRSSDADTVSAHVDEKKQEDQPVQPVQRTPIVPPSHTHVQEMARVFQKQQTQPVPTPAHSVHPVPRPIPSTPPVPPAPEPAVLVTPSIQVPAATVPKPVTPPQPIRASRYSSTPLSSLNAPAVALHIAHAEKETDASLRDDEKKNSEKEDTRSVPKKKTVKKSKTKTTPASTPTSSTAPVATPLIVEKKSRKKAVALKGTKEE